MVLPNQTLCNPSLAKSCRAEAVCKASWEHRPAYVGATPIYSSTWNLEAGQEYGQIVTAPELVNHRPRGDSDKPLHGGPAG